MGNCFITRLKATVQNSNLIRLGSLSIDCVPTSGGADEHKLMLTFNEDVTVSTTGNGKFTFLGVEYTSYTFTGGLANYTIQFSDGDYDVIFSNKYKIKQIYTVGSQSVVPCIATSTENLKYLSDIEILRFHGGGLTGDISELSGLSKLTKLNIDQQSGVVGDIASLGNNLSLSEITCSNTGIFGTVESLADAQKNDRGASTLLIYAPSTGITYNGSPFTMVTITFDGQGGYTVA